MCGALVVPATHVASAGVLLVPDKYETIAEACNAAGAGDIVLVEPGFYLGPVPIAAGVTVRSVAGPEETYISFSSVQGGPVTFYSGTGAALLEGFTISMHNYPGIAVRSFNPETVIRGNIFFGGEFNNAIGIQLEEGGLVEENALGGSQYTGVRVVTGTLTLRRNVLYFPACTETSQGLFVWAMETADSLTVEHNTFFTEPGQEITILSGVLATIRNNILGTIAVVCQEPSTVSIDYNLLYDDSDVFGCQLGPHNVFDEWPVFCSVAECDLRLTPDSPGADDGEGGVPMGAFGVGCEPVVAVGEDGLDGAVPAVCLRTPNPIRASRVSLEITMTSRGPLEFAIFDVRGAMLHRDVLWLDSGSTTHEFALGEAMPSGVYFLRATTRSWERTLRVNVIR